MVVVVFFLVYRRRRLVVAVEADVKPGKTFVRMASALERENARRAAAAKLTARDEKAVALAEVVSAVVCKAADAASLAGLPFASVRA